MYPRKGNIVSYKLSRISYYLIKNGIPFCGSRNYSKFIILSRSRTGSNFLLSLLNSHPNIDCYGELFLHLRGKDSLEIWKRIFKKHPGRIKCVGFKLFYYHPVDSDDKKVWNLIEGDPQIKIIHLKRKNLLRTILSRKIAEKTKIWKENSTKTFIPPKEKAVKLSHVECLNEFNKIRAWENEADARFSKHAIFEIYYEDLVHQRDVVMNDVYSFLNLKKHQPYTDLRKQNKEGFQDLILNYNSLKVSFTGTGWESMFEEDE